MANPITWRNVQSRGSSGVAELLNGASTSINRGISSFQGALTDQQDAQERNRLNQRENNLQNLNDAVARYDTPEALQAAQASGAFDALTSVPNMDRDAARNVADDRVTELQGLATDQYNYDQGVLDQKAAPIAENILGFINSDDDESYTAAINNPATRELLGQTGQLATLEGQFRSRNRAQSDEGFADSERALMLSDRKDEKDALQFAQDVLSDDMSLRDSEAAYAALIEENDLSAAVISRLPSDLVSRAYMQRYDVNAEEVEEIQMATRFAQGQSDSKIREATSVYEMHKRENKVNENFAVLEAGSTTIEEAVITANKNNWDKATSEWWGGYNTLTEALSKTRDKFIADQARDQGVEQLSASDLNAMDGILKVAVGAMGEAGEGWLDNNLPEDVLYEQMTDIYARFKRDERSKGILLTAEKVFNQNVTYWDRQVLETEQSKRETFQNMRNLRSATQ